MAWIDYLCQPPFSSATFDPAAKLLIQQLLEAMQAGDSCIEALPQQRALLHNLVRDHAQQGTGIARLVFEDQHLYLYRYWQLGQAVATHIARIKSQTMTGLELTARYRSMLSVPEHQ